MADKLPNLAHIQIVGRWVTWVPPAETYSEIADFNARVQAIPQEVEALRDALSALRERSS